MLCVVRCLLFLFVRALVVIARCVCFCCFFSSLACCVQCVVCCLLSCVCGLALFVPFCFCLMRVACDVLFLRCWRLCCVFDSCVLFVSLVCRVLFLFRVNGFLCIVAS